MNRSGAVLGALAIAILFGDGAFALLLTWNAAPHPETMAVAGTFPDYHGSRIGSNVSNRVSFVFQIETVLPWRRGQIQALSVNVTAQPGSGVRLVDATTLAVQLERWYRGIRTTLAEGIGRLALAGQNQWGTADGPMHLSPDGDVAGSSFFLAFAINLTVEYQDGSRFGLPRWVPDAHTAFFDILTDVAPFGVAALAAGGLGIAYLVVQWRSGRLPVIRRR